MHVGVAHDLAELLKVDLAVVVLVGEEDGLVDDLLELRVLQVGSHHHLEDLEQRLADSGDFLGGPSPVRHDLCRSSG